MSNLTVRANASGTGTVILESPNTNTNQTVTLPDATTTLVGTDATQTLTNKTIQGGALTLGTAQASTSGTAIDFTGIPSWAKRVTVMFNGVSTSGTSGIMIQIGSGSVSNSGYTTITSGFSATTLASSVVTNSIFFFPASAASMLASGICNIVNQSSNVWVANGSVYRVTDGIQNISSGAISLGGILDRIRVTTVNGTDTFDAGSINIMYEG